MCGIPLEQMRVSEPFILGWILQAKNRRNAVQKGESLQRITTEIIDLTTQMLYNTEVNNVQKAEN